MVNCCDIPSDANYVSPSIQQHRTSNAFYCWTQRRRSEYHSNGVGKSNNHIGHRQTILPHIIGHRQIIFLQENRTDWQGWTEICKIGSTTTLLWPLCTSLGRFSGLKKWTDLQAMVDLHEELLNGIDGQPKLENFVQKPVVVNGETADLLKQPWPGRNDLSL